MIVVSGLFWIFVVGFGCLLMMVWVLCGFVCWWSMFVVNGFGCLSLVGLVACWRLWLVLVVVGLLSCCWFCLPVGSFRLFAVGFVGYFGCWWQCCVFVVYGFCWWW